MRIFKNRILCMVLLMGIVFTGCSFIEQNSVDTSDGGVRVQLNVALSGSRTVMPSGFLNAKYTLTGVHSGESRVLIENKSAADLQSQVLWLEGGSWSFTLDAYVNSVKKATATLSNQTISSASTTLTFTFSGVSFNYASGTGGTSVAITYPNTAKVAAVTARLYNSDGSENAGYTLTSLTPGSYSDTLQSATFTNGNISSGAYLLVFKLYQDVAKTVEIGQWREIVNIADGCESCSVINIPNLNTVYRITYELNGLSWAEGFTAPASFISSQNVTLPVAANFADGSKFGGWYTSADFSGSAVTGWSAGDYKKDLKLYAKVSMSSQETDWTYPTTAPTLTWTGEGTLNNPYVITTSQQLADFAYMVNNGTTYSGNYIKLGVDIDLNYGHSVTNAGATYAQWKPIGTSNKAFAGTFDGNNHTVKGLYINGSCSYAGLFGYVDDSSSVVMNVCVQGYMKITNGYYVGGVVGYLKNGVISKCANKVEIIATMGNSSSYGCGGVIGYNYGTVKFCVNFKNISANINNSSNLNVGGICGYNRGKIWNSENYGDVIGVSNDTCFVGGIAGYSYSDSYSYVYNNISGGNIKGKSSSYSYTSGIAGYGYYIKNNAFYGTVDGSGTGIYLRGIGYASSTNSSYQSCNYFITSCGSTSSGVAGSVGTFTLPTDQITVYGSTSLDYTGTLLEVLNAWASANNYGTWVTGSDGWPVLSVISWNE